jgi:alpha-glucosidase
MVMSVVTYSPMQFVYWYDRPAELDAAAGQVGMEWFRRVPTVWDETRVLDGQPGEFAALARRKGTDWFVGVVTNESARQLRLPLDMLEAGHDYRAEIFVDGPGPKDVQKSVKTVRRGELLELSLTARGGVAIVLTPIR